MVEIKYVNKSSNVNNILKEYASNVTSQKGQDGILEKTFGIIGDNNYSPWCVEFGAWDGKHLSNTYNLIVNKGWSSVQIEGMDKKFLELSKNYAPYSNVYTIKTLVGFEEDNNLDSVLSTTPIPKKFGFLSIDVDGCDYHIWKSLNNYRPTVVLIETNHTVPNDIIFIQDQDMSINQGSSLLAFIELGKQKGYELIATIGQDALFVVKELYSKFNIPDNDIHKMKRDPGTRIWQTYDGTIYTSNFSRLGWKQRDIDHEELQVLPKSERFFGGRAIR